jgi:acyl carrier protein
MNEFTERASKLSPNKQALLALRLGSETKILTKTDEYTNKRLVAYVVSASGQQPANGNHLREFLKNRLPDYMLPASYVWLDALPLSPNGKIDRRSLRRPAETESMATDNYVAPRTDLENELVKIWSSVLRIERIGIEDNFFELGGHSLLATQLISRIRKTFLIELPLRSIFETPTIAGLATTVVQSQMMQQTDSAELARLLSEVEGAVE